MVPAFLDSSACSWTGHHRSGYPKRLRPLTARHDYRRGVYLHGRCSLTEPHAVCCRGASHHTSMEALRSLPTSGELPLLDSQVSPS
eukprot:44445-Lingulodinium_polyedra.AAC.1